MKTKSLYLVVYPKKGEGGLENVCIVDAYSDESACDEARHLLNTTSCSLRAFLLSDIQDGWSWAS